MILPYQIQRTKVTDHGDIAYYRYDLVNLATGKVVASAFSRSPVRPSRLAKRRAELNTRHFFRDCTEV